MNEKIASRAPQSRRTADFALSRAVDRFESLTDDMKAEFSKRCLQPKPLGEAVELILSQSRDYERLAESGWVANELRYRRLFVEFGEKKWKDAATGIKGKVKVNSTIDQLSDHLRINYKRHLDVRRTGKRVQNYKDVDPTRAIDKFFNKKSWSSEELEDAAAWMFIWPLFSTASHKVKLCLESTACLLAASVREDWLDATKGTITDRNNVGGDILNRVHCIPGLPKPWRLVHPVDLERYWDRWDDTIDLSSSFSFVYEEGIVI